ncbi:hypothetical protein AGMMS49944_12830 [Spirochaetia bacterium]|nr:hypothetical protein AGMMS49944_12830 [Spirochaetia bacterium]
MERHGGVDVEPVYKLGGSIVPGYEWLPSPDTPFNKVNIDNSEMVTRMINAYNDAPFYKQELLKKVFKLSD